MSDRTVLPLDDPHGRVFLNLLLGDLVEKAWRHREAQIEKGFEVAPWREKIIERFASEQSNDEPLLYKKVRALFSEWVNDALSDVEYCEEMGRVLRDPLNATQPLSGDPVPVKALASETGRGMDAAFYGVNALVKKHGEAFRDLELFMANHGVTSLAVFGMRVERGGKEPWPCDQSKGCPCYYGLGGSCKCNHGDDAHDDCSSGVIHCHAPKQAQDEVAVPHTKKCCNFTPGCLCVCHRGAHND